MVVITVAETTTAAVLTTVVEGTMVVVVTEVGAEVMAVVVEVVVTELLMILKVTAHLGGQADERLITLKTFKNFPS
jgi:hypothetical protein